MRAARQMSAGLLLVATLVALWAHPAAAHTGFESSDPADGAVVDAPVGVVTLVFTGEAEPTGDGFQALDSTGRVRGPNEATTADGRTWVLRFDPPLAGGVAGVRWAVKAPDAHPIEGGFSFTTPDPPATAGDETAAGEVSAAPGQDSVPDAGTTDADPGSGGSESAGLTRDGDAVDVAGFLETDATSADGARRVGAAGRFISLLGTFLGIGALVFAVTVMRGGRREVRHVLFWVRRGGILVVVGAALELVAQVVTEDGGSWSALWSPSAFGGAVATSFGIATALRVVGGCALASGARPTTAAATDVADPVIAVRERVGVGSGVRDGGPPADTPAEIQSRAPIGPLAGPDDHAWLPGVGSAAAAFGALAVLGAYAFDGHTATEGSRLLVGLVDIAHVAGGAVWAGGILVLASVLWRRYRQGRDLAARVLAIRFSVVATVALVVVGIAGLLLAITILDSPSELWSTEWGRILMVKTVLVAVAAAAGGYNHRVLVPLMERAPDDAGVARRFLYVVTGEAAVLVAVAVATALLMGAAS